MKRLNFFFLGLALAVGGVLIWKSGKFFLELYHYFSLSHQLPIEIEKWEIQEEKGGKFYLSASYQFLVGDHRFKKTYCFPKPVYLNEYLAKDHLEKWKKEKWELWYQPKNPINSSLQKLFPFKEGIHFLLTLGLFLYFLWLRWYTRRWH
ncbi:MAG: hypothetical protein HYZ47_00360 [Simkania negevensis]|nr:hypothetical protein [Simkania negevensis]